VLHSASPTISEDCRLKAFTQDKKDRHYHLYFTTKTDSRRHPGPEA